MPELFTDNVMTVAQLRKALASVPDDALVGTSMLGMIGHVEKVDRVLFNRDLNIVTFDHDRHNGSFSEDELDPKTFTVMGDLDT